MGISTADEGACEAALEDGGGGCSARGEDGGALEEHGAFN